MVQVCDDYEFEITNKKKDNEFLKNRIETLELEK